MSINISMSAPPLGRSPTWSEATFTALMPET